MWDRASFRPILVSFFVIFPNSCHGEIMHPSCLTGSGVRSFCRANLRYPRLRVSITSVNRFLIAMVTVIRSTGLRLLFIRSAIVFGIRWSGMSGTCFEVTWGTVSADKGSHLADGIGKNFIAMDCIVRRHDPDFTAQEYIPRRLRKQ